jgi:hypothetical protein
LTVLRRIEPQTVEVELAIQYARVLDDVVPRPARPSKLIARPQSFSYLSVK